MFIGEKRFVRLANAFSNLKDRTDELPFDVRFLKESMQKMIRTTLLQDKKIQNLTKVVEVLVKASDRKKLMAIADDGTKITLGDIMDAEDLLPEIEMDEVKGDKTATF